MMYFDVYYYSKVLAYTWGQRDWPGRNRMLFRLLFIVPLVAVFHRFFLLLDYVFFPALWTQQVTNPVFIVGHARSGTTLMHRLMAADGERFSYFLYWEMFFPALTQRKLIAFLGWLDARCLGAWAKKRLQAWDEKTFGPWRHIHEQGLWIPEEDQFVMNAAFVTQQWALDLPLMHELDIFHIDNLSSKRRRRWMGFYKACIKRQLLLHGGDKIHLSKNPVMSGWVNAIVDTFPDARIVVMVRDPIQCIPSTLKLVEMTWKGKGWKKNDYLPAQEALWNISYDCFEQPEKVLRARSDTPHIFVDYRKLTAEPKLTVQSVYQALALEMGESYNHYLDQHQSGAKKHTSHYRYNIEDYAISPQEIETRLAAFYELYQWPKYSEEQ